VNDQTHDSSASTVSPGVVLLHGIARTSRSLRRLEAALRQSGLATLNLDYASRRKPIEALVADIHPPIAAFATASGGPIHFVAHSMGGLLARAYIAQHRPARLGRVVMLGTPNGGSEVADLLKRFALYRVFYGPAGQQLVTERDLASPSLPPPDYPVGIIAGLRTLDPIASRFILPRPNDGRVSVASSKLEGMADHITVEASHTGLVRHPAAIAQTIAFLDHGRFESSCAGAQSCR
jgi:pimeloyl-ACP methyl ester carboxylesterase